MIKTDTSLAGVFLFSPTVFTDERGHFFESYNSEKFADLGLNANFIQDNQSFSKKGVIRGLHYQNAPHAQGKLVRVIVGKVLDVAVDLRHGSPTFGKYEIFELDSKSGTIVYIPEGFAHGFAALVDSIFQYKCTGLYNKEAERGLRWDDPFLNIPWGVVNPNVSQKDQILPTFEQVFGLP